MRDFFFVSGLRISGTRVLHEGSNDNTLDCGQTHDAMAIGVFAVIPFICGSWGRTLFHTILYRLLVPLIRFYSFIE